MPYARVIEIIRERIDAASPTAQAASSAVLKAIREANMQLVRTGDDEFMLVTYKNAKAQCDGGKCGIGGYCDDCPAPQADSQPAMTPETVYAAIAHGDEEHRAWLLSALRAVWCGEAVPPVASPIANAAADSQPAPVEVADAMADSVLEDAARWHWMAEYIVGTRTDLDDDLIASATVDELRKLVDADLATRKQGEKHDR